MVFAVHRYCSTQYAACVSRTARSAVLVLCLSRPAALQSLGRALSADIMRSISSGCEYQHFNSVWLCISTPSLATPVRVSRDACKRSQFLLRRRWNDQSTGRCQRSALIFTEPRWVNGTVSIDTPWQSVGRRTWDFLECVSAGWRLVLGAGCWLPFAD